MIPGRGSPLVRSRERVGDITLVHVALRLDGCLVYSALVQKEELLTG
jgi:hypothetical protein